MQRGFVVHGLDGLDEITTTAETRVLEIRGGAIAEQTLTPDDFGVPVAKPEDLEGADKETNREIALEVLQGRDGAEAGYRAGECCCGFGGGGQGERLPIGHRDCGKVDRSRACTKEAEGACK